MADPLVLLGILVSRDIGRVSTADVAPAESDTSAEVYPPKVYLTLWEKLVLWADTVTVTLPSFPSSVTLSAERVSPEARGMVGRSRVCLPVYRIVPGR